jgi:LmbE family N-acetylglucosaminyl deacetylase
MNLNSKSLLVIAPHPDDEMISSGGLITKMKENNSEVFVLYMCIGKSRQYVTGSTQENTRIEEAKKASDFLGFNHKFQFIGDEFMRLDLLPQKQLIEAIEDIVQHVKPNIVVIPSQSSYDQDHRVIFTAAITALRPIPKEIRHSVEFVLEAEEPHSWGIGTPFKPNLYVVLNHAQVQKKLDGLACHATQVREDPFTRSFNNLTRIAQYRGNEIGEDFAEAYFLHRGVA